MINIPPADPPTSGDTLQNIARSLPFLLVCASVHLSARMPISVLCLSLFFFFFTAGRWVVTVYSVLARQQRSRGWLEDGHSALYATK